MAERNATIKLQIRPDSNDPAAPLKAVATGAKAAATAAKELREEQKRLAREAKGATNILREMLDAQAKKTQEAKRRVDELTDALRRTGATTQQVQQVARSLGREMQLTTAQINAALQAAGQLPMAGRGGGFGGVPGKKGPPGVGSIVEKLENRERRKLVREAIEGFGPLAMGHLVLGRISGAADESLKHSTDEDLKRQIRESDDSAAKFISTFHDGIPILQQVRDLFTEGARAELEASQKSLERQKKRGEEFNARVGERVAAQIEASRNREEIAQLADQRGTERLALREQADAATRRADVLDNPRNRGLFRFGTREVHVAGTDQTISVAEGGEQRLALLAAREQAEAARRVRENAMGLADAAGGEFRARNKTIDEASEASQRARTGGDQWASAREIVAKAASEQLEALADEKRQLERARDAERKIADAAEAQARAEYDLARLKEQELSLQAQVMRGEAKKTRDAMRDAAVQFGSQTTEQQADTLQAARRFKQGGIGVLTEEELGRLKGTGLFDDEIKQQATARANRSGYGELLKLSGAEGRAANQEQRAKDLQAAADQVRIQAEVKLAFDVGQIQNALQEAFRALDQRVLALVAQAQQTNKLREQQLKTGGK